MTLGSKCEFSLFYLLHFGSVEVRTVTTDLIILSIGPFIFGCANDFEPDPILTGHKLPHNISFLECFFLNIFF